MMIIAKISDKISEEIEGAECYAKMALEYKAIDKAVADMAYTIAGQELSHVQMLHKQVTRLIGEQRSSGKEVPSGMMMVYSFQHKKEIDGVARVKMMLEEYAKA